MKSALLRTGSVPLRSPALPGSPRGVNLSRNGSGAFSVERTFNSPKISFHLEMSAAVRRDRAPIRRAVSEADVSRSDLSNSGGSQCLQPIISEEEYVSDGEGDGFLPFMSKGGDWTSYAPIKPEFAVPIEELGNSGNGNGRSGGDHGKSGGGSGDGQFGDRSKIGDYYREMLKLNPGDSLLLRNYGTFLYEVEKDAAKAEECYGRAILANPGDGEVLSLYGKLIWETHGDGERAKSYFDRAAHASPDDCMVLGSYASFMWESGDEDEEEEEVVLPAMATVV